jgi:hypothetical protein
MLEHGRFFDQETENYVEECWGSGGVLCVTPELLPVFSKFVKNSWEVFRIPSISPENMYAGQFLSL